MRVTLSIFLAMFVVSGALLLSLRLTNRNDEGQAESSTNMEKGLVANPLVSDLVIQPFSMTDQFGHAVTNDIFDDSITVIDFVFTSCPFICPTLTGRMVELSQRVDDQRVQFLSISVDPERDRPERLAEYARTNGADPLRWRFLSGEKHAVWSMVRDGLKFAVLEDTESVISLSDGGEMANIVHPPWFVIVGPQGQILDVINPMRDVDFEKIVQRVRSAIHELRTQVRRAQ